MLPQRPICNDCDGTSKLEGCMFRCPGVPSTVARSRIFILESMSANVDEEQYVLKSGEAGDVRNASTHSTSMSYGRRQQHMRGLDTVV